jgi:Uma2 family endonuclease
VTKSATALVTADELLALPPGMGRRYELVAGELRVSSPSGWRHGQVVDNVHALLSPFIRAKQLGRGFGAETGFRIARTPDTVRAPDFAFISNAPAPHIQVTDWPSLMSLGIAAS